MSNRTIADTSPPASDNRGLKRHRSTSHSSTPHVKRQKSPGGLQDVSEGVQAGLDNSGGDGGQIPGQDLQIRQEMRNDGLEDKALDEQNPGQELPATLDKIDDDCGVS